MTKKPRSHAKLLNLPEPQAAMLRELLFEGASYTEAVEFVLVNFGVSTGRSAVSGFWRQQCFPLLPVRRQSSLQTASELASSGGGPTAPFDEAAQGALQQRLFELCVGPCPDPAEIKAISSVLNQARSLALAESRMVIARSRVALDERRVACREETSSLNRRVKQDLHDRKERGLRDWDNLWAFLKSPPPASNPSAPPPHETDPNADPDSASPQAQPQPPCE